MPRKKRKILDRATDFAPNVLLARRKAAKSKMKADTDVRVLKETRDPAHLARLKRIANDPNIPASSREKKRALSDLAIRAKLKHDYKKKKRKILR